MAATATPRPGRMLAIVAGIVIALYLGVFLGPSATPALGLDLRGGVQVILTAKPLDPGKPVSKDALQQAVNIIRQRVDAAGVGGALINTQGNTNIVVSAPGANRSQLAALDQTALLNFRLVLGQAPGSGASTTTSPAPGPSATATVPLQDDGKKKSTKKTSNEVLQPALVKPFAKATPTPTPTDSATPSTSPSPTPSATTSPAATDEPKKPVPGAASPDVKEVQQVFETYDCVNGVNGSSPTLGLDKPTDYIVACDETGSVKYLLAPAGVRGAEIGSANATVDTTTNQWKVQLNFTGGGKDGWFQLTKKAYEADPSQSSSCAQVNVEQGCNSIAIVLDGVVQSAPSSQQDGIAGGQTEITGQFTQDEAKTLANVLKFGALPLKLERVSDTTVSASLGSDQLKGGLIAGIIGLVLVIIYSLLYYRALGLVTVASLALSGLVLYAVTTLLGHSSLGYTLSLPGIAGFIVAVGITADSFVVYFERIRDEVREGRRLRSAVERGWPRARRTIISADAVSLLAAVVLYLVSIGDVRGFAFTLGLSTLSDLFIVFCFTKPLLTVLSRSKTFDSGHGWTGVGGTEKRPTLEPKEA